MIPKLEISTLGNFVCRYHADQSLQTLPKPPTQKSQSLWAYLLLHRQRPTSREKLMGLFWGNRPAHRARRSLSTACWHIRRCLPEDNFIQGDNHILQWQFPGKLWLDVEVFTELAAEANGRQLQAAVDLYQGPFLDGFFDDWVIDERYRLEVVYFDLLTRLLHLYETAVQPRKALQTALALLAHDSLREDAHRSAMRAYTQLGNRNAALAQYQTCRQVIVDELGILPMPETTQLYKTIRDGSIKPILADPDLTVSPIAYPSTPIASRNLFEATMNLPFVGREKALALIQAQWEQARAGRGKLALISGEAGVGKTRLALTFAEQTQMQGAVVLYGRCYEFERLLPYQPIIEALRPFLLGLSDDDIKQLPDWTVPEIGRLLPEFLEGQPSLKKAAALAQNCEQTSLFTAVSHLLAALSSQCPILLLLEDCHWATESTLQLIHYLARHLVDRPVLIIVSYREEGIHRRHPLRALLRQWQKDSTAATVPLARLTAEDVTRFVHRAGGQEDTVLAERLYKETEGNPFFLVETIKALFETELLTVADGVWKGRGNLINQQAFPLPKSIAEAIQARALRLPDDTQDALQMTAVLGREFDFELLNATWGKGEDATLNALDDLLRCHFIHEGKGATERDYLFTHHKIQEAVYAQMPARRRQHLHAQVGQIMETIYADQPDSFAAELAHHFDQGRKLKRSLRSKAAFYLQQAGEEAAAQFANTESVAYFSRAFNLTPETESTIQYALLLARERVYALLGDRQAQGQDLETLADVSKALKDDHKQAEIAARQSRYNFVMSDFPETIEAAQRTISLAQAGRSVRLEAKGHLLWGEALFSQGEHEASRLQFEKAKTLAQSAALSKIEADSLNDLGRYFLSQSNYPEARTRFEQALDIYRDSQVGSLAGEGNILGNLGLISRNEGHYTVARDYFEQARHVFRQLGDRRKEGSVIGNLGVVSWDLGEIADARNFFIKSLHISREVDDQSSAGYCLNNLSRLSARLGDFPTAKRYLDEALPIFRTLGERRSESMILNSLGLTLAEQGNFNEAESYYKQALHIRCELGDRRGEGYCLRNLGSAALSRIDFARTKEYHDQALSIFREIGEQQGEGTVLHGLGCLAMRLGNTLEARANFEQALRIFREHGNRQSEADVLPDLGFLSHWLGDNEAALKYSQQGLLLAQELGNLQTQATALTHLGHTLARRGRLAEAADAYQQALTLRRDMDQHTLAMNPLAGLVHVFQEQSDLAGALVGVEEILGYLETHAPDGTDDPFRIYLTCYRVLHAGNDSRADDILITAYNLLQTQAATIPDEDDRRSFLENVPTHRDIIKTFNATSF